MSRSRIEQIARMILSLTPAEAIELQYRLRGEDPPEGAGVREPRRPTPPTRGAAAEREGAWRL